MYMYTKQKKNENEAVNRPLSEREGEKERAQSIVAKAKGHNMQFYYTTLF